MLTDLGLQTPEQIKEYNDYASKRAKDSLKGIFNGCVGSRICEQCNHLISDSICLCIPIFDCPNCGFKNGTELAKQYEEAKNLPPINFLGTNGIQIPSENKTLFTAAQREEILNRCKYSAQAVKLDEEDLRRIINMFEYSDIKPAKIGNIIKYICVCVEKRN